MQAWMQNGRPVTLNGQGVLCGECPCDDRLGVCFDLLFEPYFIIPPFTGCGSINKTYHPTIYTFEQFDVDVQIIVCNGSFLCDDDLEINDEIIAEGLFPFVCPENGRHSFSSGTILKEIPKNTEIVIKIIDWYGPPSEGYGGIEFVKK